MRPVSAGWLSLRCAAALSVLLLAGPRPAPALELPPPPHDVYGELFERVQLAGVYPDGKDFVDATPKYPPADILARFRADQPRTLEELRRFVADTFTAPQSAATPVAAAGGPAAAAGVTEPVGGRVPLAEHIDALWDVLTRHPGPPAPYSSLLPLPEPFVVPGGRFREIYYWDSYFTMLGLLTSGRRDLTQSMVTNFAHLLDTFGRIPNGNRTYYLSRSQPPFFFAMVALLSPEHPEQAYARYLPQLKREHAFWMEGAASVAPGSAARRVVALAPGVTLNRYWDDDDQPRDESYREDLELAQRTPQRKPAEVFRDVRAAAESGWDFSSRWLTDKVSLTTINTTAIVPADLNSLLYGLERAIAAGCAQSGDQSCAQDFNAQAAARRRAMNRYLWVGARGLYLDYDWQHGHTNPGLSAATFYPLFTGAASRAQAAAVAKNAAPLLKRGGLVTTTLTSGQQWDAPNGWAPLQWVAIAGLRAYGHTALAEQIACRWLVNVTHVYEESGKLVEKYDVVDPGRAGGGGEYPTQDGFGWTNGVTRKLLVLYAREATFRSVAQCPAPPPAAVAAH